MGGGLRVESIGVQQRWWNQFVMLATLVAGCRSRASTTTVEDPWAQAPAASPRVVDAGTEGTPSRAVAGELLPGTLRAFGVLMPVGTTEVLNTDNERMFYVQAPMAAVMRYLQARVEIVNGEIHPLGAFVRNAHVQQTNATENFTVDLGVRDEGDRTLVTLWNRSQAALPPRSTDEGFRAAGFDPATRRPTGQNNF